MKKQIEKSNEILLGRLIDNKHEKEVRFEEVFLESEKDMSDNNTSDNVFEVIEINSDSDDTDTRRKKLKGSRSRSITLTPLGLQCEQCKVVCESKRLLSAHMMKHKFTVCPICSSSIRSDNFKRHYEMHSAGAEICEICGKTAKNKESLRGHMFHQHRENAPTYKCDHCGRLFNHRYKYTMHIKKTHTGERDHQCEVCGKKFFTAFDTKKHVDMTHLRQRPHVCSYCLKGFSSRYALKTHVRQHTQETPYRCDYCALGFRQKVSLKTHLKSKHGVVLGAKGEGDTDKGNGTEEGAEVSQDTEVSQDAGAE